MYDRHGSHAESIVVVVKFILLTTFLLRFFLTDTGPYLPSRESPILDRHVSFLVIITSPILNRHSSFLVIVTSPMLDGHVSGRWSLVVFVKSRSRFA